jgi:hypothetical protein
MTSLVSCSRSAALEGARWTRNRAGSGYSVTQSGEKKK